MTKTIARKRFYAEVWLAVLATSIGVLTIFWREWIEALTSLDPDGGDGSAEWLIVAGLFMVAAVCALLAQREYARARLRRTPPTLT
jgi:hypothetical protein